MNEPAPRSARSLWRIFRWPLVLAVVSLVGLIAALVGDGWFDVVSWTSLGLLPVLLIRFWQVGARD